MTQYLAAPTTTTAAVAAASDMFTLWRNDLEVVADDKDDDDTHLPFADPVVSTI